MGFGIVTQASRGWLRSDWFTKLNVIVSIVWRVFWNVKWCPECRRNFVIAFRGFEGPTRTQENLTISARVESLSEHKGPLKASLMRGQNQPRSGPLNRVFGCIVKRSLTPTRLVTASPFLPDPMSQRNQPHGRHNLRFLPDMHSLGSVSYLDPLTARLIHAQPRSLRDVRGAAQRPECVWTPPNCAAPASDMPQVRGRADEVSGLKRGETHPWFAYRRHHPIVMN